MDKHCPSCSCAGMRTLPMFGSQEAQIGVMLVAPNAEGFLGRAYKMPRDGVTAIADLEPHGPAGQYDHDGTLVRELPEGDPRHLPAGTPADGDAPFWAGLA